jgi:hypothetical protein
MSDLKIGLDGEFELLPGRLQQTLKMRQQIERSLSNHLASRFAGLPNTPVQREQLLAQTREFLMRTAEGYELPEDAIQVEIKGDQVHVSMALPEGFVSALADVGDDARFARKLEEAAARGEI